MAIGCGVIVAALFLAAFAGYRWVQKNRGLTEDPALISEWSVEIMGCTPPERFQPRFGMYLTEDKVESVLFFSNPLARDSHVDLTLFTRSGVHDLDTAFSTPNQDLEGMQIDMEDTVGEVEDSWVMWGEKRVPVRLWEGYREGLMIRHLVGILNLPDYAVIIHYHGSPEALDRDLVQETVDRIPEGWHP